jgi:hypothetical protein
MSTKRMMTLTLAAVLLGGCGARGAHHGPGGHGGHGGHGGNQATATHGLIALKSPYAPAETMNRLEAEVKKRNLAVVSRIDHAAAAQRIGQTLRPTELLVFGNPQAGTPLMLCAQLTGIDLPMKAPGVGRRGRPDVAGLQRPEVADPPPRRPRLPGRRTSGQGAGRHCSGHGGEVISAGEDHVPGLQSPGRTCPLALPLPARGLRGARRQPTCRRWRCSMSWVACTATSWRWRGCWNSSTPSEAASGWSSTATSTGSMPTRPRSPGCSGPCWRMAPLRGNVETELATDDEGGRRRLRLRLSRLGGRRRGRALQPHPGVACGWRPPCCSAPSCRRCRCGCAPTSERCGWALCMATPLRWPAGASRRSTCAMRGIVPRSHAGWTARRSTPSPAPTPACRCSRRAGAGRAAPALDPQQRRRRHAQLPGRLGGAADPHRGRALGRPCRSVSRC